MKAYIKPDFYYENFELNQSIAACGIDVNLANTTDCQPRLDPDFWGISDTVFNSDEDRCQIYPDVIEAYCYTNGTNEAGRTFNS